MAASLLDPWWRWRCWRWWWRWLWWRHHFWIHGEDDDAGDDDGGDCDGGITSGFMVKTTMLEMMMMAMIVMAASLLDSWWRWRCWRWWWQWLWWRHFFSCLIVLHKWCREHNKSETKTTVGFVHWLIVRWVAQFYSLVCVWRRLRQLYELFSKVTALQTRCLKFNTVVAVAFIKC